MTDGQNKGNWWIWKVFWILLGLTTLEVCLGIYKPGFLNDTIFLGTKLLNHVFSGVIFLIILLINVIYGTYEKRGHYEMVEKVGLYWHFVDLVWVFVFTFFYLV